MRKSIGTTEDIREVIQRRIENSKELDGDCKDCRAPTPHLTDPATNSGFNWTVDVFPDVIPGCLEFLKSITWEVMAEYELNE